MSAQGGYERFANRVLIVLVGRSPAVLTETIHALVHEIGGRRFVPTSVVVLTTAEGRTAVTEALLQPGIEGTRWQRLFAVLDMPLLPLTEASIQVPQLEGVDIADAHSRDELDLMGDLILLTLREHTSRDDTAVVLSMSGGRKSMSHLAGQAMSIRARAWDRLVHVVVQPAWLEQMGEFTFPDAQDGEYEGFDEEGQALEGSPCAWNQVELRLTDEPFLLLRPLLEARPEFKDTAKTSFRELVAMLSAAPPMELAYSSNKRQMWLRGESSAPEDAKPLKLTPVQLAYLQIVIARGQVPRPCSDELAIAWCLEWEEVTLSRRLGPEADRQALGTNRYEQCAALFNVSAPGQKLAKELNSFLPDEISPKFIWPSRGMANDQRIRRQAGVVSFINKAIGDCLPATVNPDHYKIPVGMSGQGRGVDAHRLPPNLRAVALDSGSEP